MLHGFTKYPACCHAELMQATRSPEMLVRLTMQSQTLPSSACRSDDPNRREGACIHLEGATGCCRTNHSMVFSFKSHFARGPIELMHCGRQREACCTADASAWQRRMCREEARKERG